MKGSCCLKSRISKENGHHENLMMNKLVQPIIKTFFFENQPLDNSYPSLTHSGQGI